MVEAICYSIKDPRWSRVIEQNPTATIFHHPAWMETLSSCYKYRFFIFSTVDQNGDLCAGLPIAEINHPVAPRRWVVLPFSDYCSPLYRDEESLKELIDLLVDQQRTNLCPKVEIRAPLPARSGLQLSSSYVLHTIPLKADPELVATRVSRQQKQNVRTAEKNEIRIVRGTGLDELGVFFRLHTLSRRKHGVPVQPWKYFKLLGRNILQPGLGFILLAYKENTCISAGLFLHWQKTLTYKYSATDESAQNLRPNHLITWTAMKWGCANGFTTFDFGRADVGNAGLRAYKTRWGADETPLSYSYIPTAPASMRSGSGNGRMANLLKSVIRRSPVWICQGLGELFYRYAG
jgi:hypothetical protein